MAERVTVSDAAAFLSPRYPAVWGLTPIGHGEWSSAFTFRLGERHLVVRFGAHLDDFERDRWAAQHSSPKLPVPQVLELGEALGGYFCVSERAFGRYLDELDGPELSAALPGLFEALDALRLVPMPAGGFGIIDGTGRAGFADWRSFLLDVGEPAERLPGWRERLAHHREAQDVFERGLQVLRGIALPDVEANLVHADLLNFNVLIDRDRPSGILDWGSALAGDHVYDVAWLVFCQSWYPAWGDVDITAAAQESWRRRGVEVPNFEGRFRACLIHIGLGSIRYNAFVGRGDVLAEAVGRTREVLEWTRALPKLDGPD